MRPDVGLKLTTEIENRDRNRDVSYDASRRKRTSVIHYQ